MKRIINHIVTFLLLVVPLAGEAKTVAYSPSIPGQPLVFHFDTSLNTIQPSQFSAITWTQLENALLVRSSYTEHLDNVFYRNCCSGVNLWVDGMGQWQQQNAGDKHQFGFNVATGGITLGAETCCNDFIIGAAVSYTHSNLRWNRSAGNGQIDSYYGGLYGSWNNGCFYLNASLLGAFNDYHTSRHYEFQTIDQHAHAQHNGWEALAGIETGLLLNDLFCCIDLIPYVSFDYIYLSQQGYSERGAERYNLNLRNRNDQLLQSELGLEFNRRFPCECCCRAFIFAPNLSISYINQSPLTGRSLEASFVGRDNEFNVNGWDFERNLGAIALNFNFIDCAETVGLSFHYEGQFGKNYWNQTGSVMCNVCF